MYEKKNRKLLSRFPVRGTDDHALHTVAIRALEPVLFGGRKLEMSDESIILVSELFEPCRTSSTGGGSVNLRRMIRRVAEPRHLLSIAGNAEPRVVHCAGDHLRLGAPAGARSRQPKQLVAESVH